MGSESFEVKARQHGDNANAAGGGLWGQAGEFYDTFSIGERPPYWEEDGYIVTRLNARTAPGCHDNCGLLAYVKDGKLEKIEGDPLNPYNQGRVCARCLALDETLYNPQRLKMPLKRAGERGENKWEEVSWDEAYDIIEENWRKIIAESGPEAISITVGTGRDYCGYMTRLASAIGTPNWGAAFLSGTSCYGPRLVSTICMLGDFVVADMSQYLEKRYDDPRWECPELVLQWGCNTVVSNSDGFLGHWVVEAMKRGAKLVTIDPALTWMAGKSEVWLPIRPGTDGALALALCNVIIKEELYDHDFVEKWTYGLDAFAERCEQYTPEYAAEICGLEADDIVKVARMYAKAKPACTQWGLAIDTQHGGYSAGCGIMNLWALTGNIDNPGGNILSRPAWGISQTWMGGWADWDGVPGHPDGAILSDEQDVKRINHDLPLCQMTKMVVPDFVAEAAITGDPYRIRSFYLTGTNPIVCMGADAHKTYDALMASDFNVAVDLFLTPTVVGCCDLVLPVTTFIEREGIVGFTHTYVGALKPAVQPTGQQKSDVLINVELGRRFCPEAYPEEWKSDREIADHFLRRTGVNYEQLAERTWIRPRFEYYKYKKGMLREDGSLGFNTPSGRYEFNSTLLGHLGLNGLPDFIPTPEGPFSTPELMEEYPLMLVSGSRKWGMFHTEHRDCPSLRRIDPEPTVKIHPETAAQYGIAEGDMVLIENMFGSYRQKAVLSAAIRKDTVFADHGWWFPERGFEDGTLGGCFEANPNCCVPMRPGDVGFGASYKTVICRISRVAEQEQEVI